MLWLTGFLPDDWRTSITVHRGGGRDPKGNPQPTEDHEVSHCLIGPRSTSEPVDRSELVDSTAVLYREATAAPAFVFLATDQLTIPEGHRMAGRWAVDGRPGEWPLGTELALRRA